MTKRLRSIPALALASLAVSSTVSAIDASGIAIHGSLSATGAYSDKYDYYGETADHFDVIAQEVTINGTYRFENGLRVAAQVYAYELADYSAVTLDFATLDYAFSEHLGVRAGRNKLPQGLYGEVQDLDQIRTFASLPLNFYPRALRSLSAGYNGAGLYGTVSLAKAGSLEYQAFFGWMDNIDGDAPYTRGLADLTVPESVDLDQVYGGNLIWNLPVEGLKLAYTYNYLPGVKLASKVQTRAALTEMGSSYAAVAAMIDAGYGAGTWDYSGLFAGSPGLSEVDVTVQVFSAEYTHEKWIAAAEYKTMKNSGTTSLLAAPPFRTVNASVSSSEEHWYVQTTYQATDKIGLGVYYAQSDFDPDNKNASDDKFTSINDLAAAASYALTSNWLFKVEAHALDGLGKLNIAGDHNKGATDASWNYFVVKATFSF
ncbi:MAG: hypothetical protein QM760_06500 [Nibricoccus sp.]